MLRRLAVVGVQERTVLDGVRVVAGAVAVFAPERPELGTNGARVVPDQVAAVHLGRLVVFVTERAIVFHQLVDDGAVVRAQAVVQAGRPEHADRGGPAVVAGWRRQAVAVGRRSGGRVLTGRLHHQQFLFRRLAAVAGARNRVQPLSLLDGRRRPGRRRRRRPPVRIEFAERTARVAGGRRVRRGRGRRGHRLVLGPAAVVIAVDERRVATVAVRVHRRRRNGRGQRSVGRARRRDRRVRRRAVARPRRRGPKRPRVQHVSFLFLQHLETQKRIIIAH